jgi:nicotinate-nucleotide adenylyltransferase
MSAGRIGILGGTFDPIHVGHTGAARAASDALDLSRLLVIPSNIPPHRPQTLASSYHRFAMAALAVAGQPRWTVCDLELRRDTRSYTSDTLRRFHARGYAASDLFFLIGADAFAEIGSWKDYPQILDAAHFAVVSRPGRPADEIAGQLPLLASRIVRTPLAAGTRPSIILITAATADVSSTAIRRARAEGRSITGMVDPGVQQHIEQHGLYSPILPGRRRSDGRAESSADRLHGQD